MVWKLRNRRRLALSLIGVLILMATSWWVVGVRTRRPPAESGAAGDPESLRIRDLELGQSVPLSLREPTQFMPEPPQDSSPPAHVIPSPPRPPAEPIDPQASTAPPALREPSIQLAAMESDDTPLRPRVLVHPRVPKKVTAHKIDDTVLLQALVGESGQVLQVHVLHGIDDCDECTQSAIDAMKGFRYEPPMVDGRSCQMWTNPVKMRFTFRR